MASTADIKKGLCIRFNHDIYKIIEFLHVKPGKGPARVETRSFQYLYEEGNDFVFMNTEDFHQVNIRKDMLDYPELLKEGEVVMIIFNAEDETPLSVEMPANVILTVTHVEPGVKGNTATNATKPATVETGAIVNVPLFINEGDRIKIETEKGTYVERIKE